MYEGNGQKPTKKGVNKWVLGIGAAVLAVVFFLIGWFAKFYSIDPRMRTLMWMIDTLEKKYYQEVDLDKLYDARRIQGAACGKSGQEQQFRVRP